MNHLTTLESGFLKAEDADHRVSLAIAGLAVIECPAPDQDALVSAFAQHAWRRSASGARRLALAADYPWLCDPLVTQRASSCPAPDRT